MAMFAAYYRARLLISIAVAALVLLLLAGTELQWATRYADTRATIVGIEQTCAGGSRAPGRHIPCSEALDSADRRTTLSLRYVSPADLQEHQAAVRCDTRRDETPAWLVGQQVTILAHKSKPELIKRRRCTSVEPTERGA